MSHQTDPTQSESSPGALQTGQSIGSMLVPRLVSPPKAHDLLQAVPDGGHEVNLESPYLDTVTVGETVTPVVTADAMRRYAAAATDLTDAKVRSAKRVINGVVEHLSGKDASHSDAVVTSPVQTADGLWLLEATREDWVFNPATHKQERKYVNVWGVEPAAFLQTLDQAKSGEARIKGLSHGTVLAFLTASYANTIAR